MDKVITTNTLVTIKNRLDNRYLTASGDGALVHWRHWGKYGWSEKKAQWRLQWLKASSWDKPGMSNSLARDLNLWSIYNKAFAIADLSSNIILIQTDRPPPSSEGGCRFYPINIVRKNGDSDDGMEVDGTLVLWRYVEMQTAHFVEFEVTLKIVEINSSKSPKYNAELCSRGASAVALTNSSLPGWQVGQVIFGAADKTLSSAAAYFPRSFNSGSNVNYSGKQTNGDVRDADAIEY